jgi:putative phosphoesterase
MSREILGSIGVVSDTHGDAACFETLLGAVFRDADMIIHAGDILYHGPRNPVVAGYNPGRLAEILNGYGRPILFARGNCDADVDQLMLEWPIQSPYLFADTGLGRIIACHGETLDRDKMLNIARRYKADIFISGHTHIPLLERVGGAVLLNPGSPSLPKGEGVAACAVITAGEILVSSADGRDTLIKLKR